ncbi:hypothetical protein DDT46_01495 [Mycobacteroides abscessus]|uniref:hypothetical protein n=1 Tax=Mycobacteroides abscessus TaxID=36809 RepID=UPI000D52F3C5|nr:hypothetical protein [Mycobacteroides abscessus]AWG62611.1 hypothetical protein DDT46_01495 [Mycobacteroides abscessus]
MSRKSTTFVDACLSGDAFAADIDDWVDSWHDTEFAGNIPSLNEYLGFTPDEGKLWVEKPTSLGAIIAARKTRKPVEEVLGGQASYALAARSVSPEDARDVLEWLIERGRIKQRPL